MGRKRNRGPCVYCGQPATTRDHIPPQCLFGKKKPSNLITVPACAACNHGAKLNDEYAMRLALVDGTERTRAGREVDEAFHRAITRPQAKGLRYGFLRTVHPVDVFTPSGRLYLGRRLAFDLDWDRMAAWMDRLIRGFFWKIKNRRLPEGYGTDWHPVTTAPNISLEKEQNQRIISKGPFLDFGDGTFRVRAISSHNESNLALFRFDFF